MTRRLFPIVVAVSMAIMAVSASAEDDNYMRLARLSYLEGHVSYQHISDVDWSAASVNFPLEPGDRIYTGRDGRAEMQFDDGSAFRLAENTDFEILSLKDDLIQVRILVGLATLTAAGSVDFEIDTPAAAFNTLRKGVYRFDVVESGDTDAIVRKGYLEAANNAFNRRIESGELLHVRAGEDANPVLSQYNNRDLWDEWNDRRTADLRAYISRDHLPNNVYIGVSEMDRYGHWVDVDTYGLAWVPSSVAVDWTPYSVGRWCYRPLYGWTWVSYETWGWLPYHYGRWFRSPRHGWCWIPGPAFSFNFWSPGLVVFYNGPGWVSWCPLGPGDYYNINNYYYNHRIYSYQLVQLRTLHVRKAEDPFNRHVHGAFRTVAVETFKNGSFGEKNAGAGWKMVDQPWSKGSLVKDRLAIPPSTVSFRPAPGLRIAQPKVNNSMTVVVRSKPNVSAGSRDRFVRISNPEVPAVPAKEYQGKNRPTVIESRTAGAETSRRVIPTPTRDRADDSRRVLPGSAIFLENGRWVNKPSRSDAQENSGASIRSAPGVTPDRTPSVRPIAPRVNNEGPAVREPRTVPPVQQPLNEGLQRNRREEPRPNVRSPQVIPRVIARPPAVNTAPSTQGRNTGPNPAANSNRSQPDNGRKDASSKDNSGERGRGR
jgi:hypothetical protein